MIDLLRATTRVSFSMVTTMISSIAKNKLLAIIIGPVGLGVYSQVQSVLTLLSTVLPVGSLGMVNSISSLHQKESYNQIASLLRFFFIRNIVLSLLVCLLIFVFSDFLSGILFRDLIINSVILSICIAVPLNVIFNFIEIYLKGIRRIELYVSFSILNSVFSLLITIPLVVFYGISGVLLAIPLTFIFGISVGVYIISKNNLVLKQSDKEEVSKDLIRNVYVMGLGGFLTMFMQHLSLLIIKTRIASDMGLDNVGIFHSVYTLSSAYFSIFFSIIGTYSIPKLASLDLQEEVVSEVNDIIRLLVLIYIPLVIFIYAFRTFVIGLLFSGEFIGAKYLLLYQLPAEFFKAMSWALGLFLIRYYKVKLWVTLDFVFYISFIVIFFILLNLGWGIISVSISYFISYLVFFVMNLLVSMKQFGFQAKKPTLNIFLVGLAVFLIILLSSTFNEYIGFYIAPVFILFWIYFVFKNKSFEQIKNIMVSLRK